VPAVVSAIHVPNCDSATKAASPPRPARRGFGIAPLAALVLGIGCVFAALMTGMVLSPQTADDWRAVQTWRTEWFLGAIAFFLLGLLLHALQSR